MIGVLEETVNISVLIAERLYPLRVAKSDEAKVRDAVKLVNNRIKEYQDLYAGKDKQDYLAMCLLNYAVEQSNNEAKIDHTDRSIADKLRNLEEILSGTLV